VAITHARARSSYRKAQGGCHSSGPRYLYETYTSAVATCVGSVLKTFAAEETPPPLVRLTLQPGDLALKYDGGQRIRENMWGGGVPREALRFFKRPRRMRWRR